VRFAHLKVVELIWSEKSKGVNRLREVFIFLNFLERLLNLQLGVDEPLVLGIGIQFLLNHIQVAVGALTHRYKPLEELEKSGAALGRAGAMRSTRSSCGRRWRRRSSVISIGRGG
jgi:hypothetical protein